MGAKLIFASVFTMSVSLQSYIFLGSKKKKDKNNLLCR